MPVALAEDQSSDLSTYGEWLTNATTPAPGNLLHSLNLLGHQIDSPHTLFFFFAKKMKIIYLQKTPDL